MKNLLILISIPLLLFSCKKKIYHSFTDEERAFLVYEHGDTFKLKDVNSGEILTYTVTSKSVEFEPDFGPLAGGRKEHFMERGRIEFERLDNSSNSGYIYIYKDKVDQFSLGIDFKHNISFRTSGNHTPTSIENLNINGVKYDNVHNYDNAMYFSKDVGFVKLVYQPSNILLEIEP